MRASVTRLRKPTKVGFDEGTTSTSRHAPSIHLPLSKKLQEREPSVVHSMRQQPGLGMFCVSSSRRPSSPPRGSSMRSGSSDDLRSNLQRHFNVSDLEGFPRSCALREALDKGKTLLRKSAESTLVLKFG